MMIDLSKDEIELLLRSMADSEGEYRTSDDKSWDDFDALQAKLRAAIGDN